MEFLDVFTSPDAWVGLITLIFLELVLGIDNLVFICLTTDRLPENKQHIGRRFGLLAALIMRILLLFSITWVMSLQVTLFTLPFDTSTLPLDPDVSGRDLILFVGGLYLIYKGIAGLYEKISLKEERETHGHPEAKSTLIGLPQAVLTIAAMDVIFSLDSVITAVGMVGELPIMVIAVIVAVLVMIIFADPIAGFISKHSEIKILALTFIVIVGVMLTCESFEIHLSKGAVYFAMGFALALDLLQMWYNKRLNKMKEEIAQHKAAVSAARKSTSCISADKLFPSKTAGQDKEAPTAGASVKNDGGNATPDGVTDKV